MNDSGKIEQLKPRWVAAVRRTAATREIPSVFKPALDLVWAFLGKHKGLRTDGHNVLLDHHVQRPQAGMAFVSPRADHHRRAPVGQGGSRRNREGVVRG